MMPEIIRREGEGFRRENVAGTLCKKNNIVTALLKKLPARCQHRSLQATMSPEVVMPIANVIEDEIQQLIRFQIDNFRQPTPLTSSQLDEHHRRSEKIRILSIELDRIGTRRAVDEFRRSS
jgi:hypothetical protein